MKQEPTTHGRRSTARIVKAAQLKAYDTTSHLISEAGQQAESILAEAHSKSQEICARAEEAGFAKGMAQAAQILMSAERMREQLINRTEAELIDLCMQCVRHVVSHSLELDPSLVEHVMAQALSKLQGARHVSLVVHPEDAPLVEAFLTRAKLESYTPLVQTDSSMARGGCVVLSDIGEIDARIETRLDTLERELKSPHSS